MARSRWQHLDLERPHAPSAERAASPHPGTPTSQHPSTPTPNAQRPAPNAQRPTRKTAAPPDHPALQAARGYYHLRQFQACADVIRAELAAVGELPGAQRLLGMALGRADDPAGAAEALAAAVALEPDDPELRASLLSAQVQCDIAPEAPPDPPAGPLGELVGAAAWLRGRGLLAEGRAAEAAASFLEASRLLALSSPASVAADRLAACYVSEAVSRLAAGQLDAAQQGFARFGGAPSLSSSTARAPALTRAVVDFARQLYEVADAARALPPSEREAALAPLAGIVVNARLRVRFYDQSRPVAMHWEGLP